MRPQEPIHLRNRELLALRDQLLRRLDELQREQEAKKARSGAWPIVNVYALSPSGVFARASPWVTTWIWLTLSTCFLSSNMRMTIRLFKYSSSCLSPLIAINPGFRLWGLALWYYWKGVWCVCCMWDWVSETPGCRDLLANTWVCHFLCRFAGAHSNSNSYGPGGSSPGPPARIGFTPSNYNGWCVFSARISIQLRPVAYIFLFCFLTLGFLPLVLILCLLEI